MKKYLFLIITLCIQNMFSGTAQSTMKLDKYDKKLITAVKKQNLNDVKKALANGADINVQDKHGNTPLHTAIKNNDKNTVLFLLKNKTININHKNTFDQSPLMYAVDKQNADIVKLLLQHPGIDVNTQNYDKETPLHRAALKGHKDIVQFLLSHPKINVNLKDSIVSATPLHNALLTGQYEITKLLLNHPKINLLIEDGANKTPLYFIISLANYDPNRIKLIQRLLEHGAPVEQKSLDYYRGETGIIVQFLNNAQKIDQKNLSFIDKQKGKKRQKTWYTLALKRSLALNIQNNIDNLLSHRLFSKKILKKDLFFEKKLKQAIEKHNFQENLLKSINKTPSKKVTIKFK